MVSGKDSTPDPHIDGILKAALTEDLGTVGDITSDATVPEGAETTGRIVARAGGCIAGLGPALRVFSLLDDSIATSALESDGTMVDAGTDLATIPGPHGLSSRVNVWRSTFWGDCAVARPQHVSLSIGLPVPMRRSLTPVRRHPCYEPWRRWQFVHEEARTTAWASTTRY